MRECCKVRRTSRYDSDVGCNVWRYGVSMDEASDGQLWLGRQKPAELLKRFTKIVG